MRARIVRFPPAPGLRPTPDRVRETLFNWLGQDLTGRRTLDPFTGSGALSLEAASRGAALCVAIDRDPRLARALDATAREFGLPAIEARVGDAYALLAREARRFDVVFLDPPFGAADWERLLPLCAARLAPDGRLYAESPSELGAQAGLSRLRHARAGRVHYHLFAKPAAPPPSPDERSDPPEP